MKLYEAVREITALETILEDEEQSQEELTKRLDYVWTEADKKFDSICKYRSNLKAEAASLKAEAARLTAKQKTVENKIKSLENYLKCSMQALDIQKHKCEFHTVSITKPRERLELADQEELAKDTIWWPDDVQKACVTTEVKVNRAILKQQFEKDIPSLKGITIVMGEPGVSIR